jgi:hypothetical protein
LPLRPRDTPDLKTRQHNVPAAIEALSIEMHAGYQNYGLNVRVRSRINSCAWLRGLPPAIIEMLAQITAHIRA